MSGKMRFTSILAVLALFCGLAFGQTETGSVFGTVTDPQGAVVAGAKVTIKSSATNAERTTTTNSNGLYTFTNLQPGPYKVTVDAANFASTAKALDVNVGSRNTVDFPLAVTGGSTVVEVQGEGGVAINTSTQDLGQTVSSRQITELPTLTRNAYSLVSTAGNVSGADPSGRGVGVAINGQRAASTSILLDGGENVDLFTAAIGQQTPLDSVGEFKVITNNFSAEYGRASGGIVNVSTKSGTNSFHGSVFEFYRGSNFASNTYNNNAVMDQAHKDFLAGLSTNCPTINDVTCPGRKDRFVRNQFGYSIGGPAIKDKLFFFSNTEWIRIRSNGSRIAVVPNDTFIAASAAATQAYFAAFGPLKSGLPVIGSYTPTDFIGFGATCPSGSAPTWCAYAGANPNTPIFDVVQYTVPSNGGGGTPENEYQNVERVDFNWTDKTTMYGRYALQSIDLFPGTVSNSPYDGPTPGLYDTGEKIYNNNMLFNVTHIWTPNLVTQSKVVFNRLNDFQPLNGPPTPTMYFRDNTTYRINGDRAAFPGTLPYSPGSGIPFGGPQNLYQFYQDASWTKGKHQFRFGGQYIHTRDNRTFGAYENSTQALGSSSNPRTALNRFLTGSILRFQGAINPDGHFPCKTDPFGVQIVVPECQLTLPVGPPRFDRANRYHDFAFYGQDSWKVASRFTLNLGLRWEYYGVQHNNDPSFDSNFYNGPGANAFEQLRNGQVFTVSDPANPVGGLWEKDLNNFAPRVGFAWDLFGDGKTSLRGGYGISYERNFGNVTFNAIQNPPNYGVLALNNVAGECGNPCPIFTSNFGPLGTGVGVVNMPKVSLRMPKQDMQTAYAEFWSLALEREVAKNTVMALEYSGSRGLHDYSIESNNRVGYGPLFMGDNPGDQFLASGSCLGLGNCALRRINDQYTNTNKRGDNGFSYYNALNVRVQSNNLLNSGLSFVTNYTWAHSIDNLSSTFSESSNNFDLGLTNPFRPADDKGDADFDIRHRFVMSGTWDTPWFKNDENWIMKNILGGWTIAPIISVQGGSPYTIWDCSAIAFAICQRGTPIGTFSSFSAPEPTLVGTNVWQVYDLAAIGSNTWVNPVLGTGEAGVCGVGEGAINGCPWPADMLHRNTHRGYGLWNVDMGLYKNIALTERFKLQIRTEAYNLANHSNLYIQGDSADFADIGVIAKRGGFGNAPTDERRHMMFGLRLLF